MKRTVKTVTGSIFNIIFAAVVYEYRPVAGHYIVRVGVGDGEVVDGGLGGGVALDGGDLDSGAGAGLEPLTCLQVGGVDPLAEFGCPEGVPVGGGDRGCGGGVVAVVESLVAAAAVGVAVGGDGDGDEVFGAGAGDGGGDGFGLGVAGFGVGGQDLVAGCDVFDGFGGPSAMRTRVPGVKLLSVSQPPPALPVPPLPLVPPSARVDPPEEPPGLEPAEVPRPR
jgi:hypothetical protein